MFLNKVGTNKKQLSNFSLNNTDKWINTVNKSVNRLEFPM